MGYLKKMPGKVTFASSGAGSSDHLTAALFWQKTGTTGIHVPYKGGGPAINDLIAGHANVSFQNYGSIAQQVKSGKLKALGVTSDRHVSGSVWNGSSWTPIAINIGGTTKKTLAPPANPSGGAPRSPTRPYSSTTGASPCSAP